MIDLDLVLLNMEAKTSTDVINDLGKLMLNKNYVKDSYINAVIDREKELPTGLNIGNFYVAIPHTDSNHVNKSNIAIATLKSPVEFREMINPEGKINVELVFLLAVKDPKEQVTLLKSLMSVFQNKQLLIEIKNAKDKQEVAELLKNIII
ncbi:PTS sugar transporter subunit IIA [Clostridium lacusfryxellense]|uniref:PTS sugar transporter subunit IIA n=1 Tax=Clostridium lacusfryxellense TaxID=205328 RepID=UPI001FE43499|nr:PTS sugar transporter subunit IIA [Clostridium lacusfryxellense]